MSKRIGKNLSNLLANIEDARVNLPVLDVVDGERIYNLDITQIKPNPDQPRKSFGDKEQKELEDSIRIHGIIQPLILVKLEESSYMIVAGERRYRAALRLGLKTVPSVVKKLTEQKIREFSLIENLQRENLNAIEEAEALKELAKEHNLTQEDLALRIGKSRSNIANTLRLLSLPGEVIDLVRCNRLSAGHARTLIPIADQNIQIELAYKACDNQMSVRDIENKVRLILNPNLQKKMAPEERQKLSLEMRSLVDDMKRIFSTKVKVVGNDSKGRIYIDYYTKDDLQRVFELMEILKNRD